jgi:hypothetical protein
MDTQKVEPSWLELESVLAPPRVEAITSLSWETIQRRYRDKVIDLSPRRRGMKLRDVLAITSVGKA